MRLDNIVKPTLLLNEAIARQNIDMMKRKADDSNTTFRPHFKTHFSKEIGNWYKDAGITKITCSSIDMTMYFAQHGWEDITIAFPTNVRQIADLNNLSEKIRLNLVVESIETADTLCSQLKHTVDIFIKIDTGYGRTGVKHDDFETIDKIVKKLAGKLQFKGLLAHFGHSYKEKSASAIREIYQKGVTRLHEIKTKLSLPNCQISIGDTPTCSVMESFEEVDEIRPGNFVFYDLMQAQIGSCDRSAIAVCLAAPIVAIHKRRNELIIHGGAVHLSKEYLLDEDQTPYYGQVVLLNSTGWRATEYPMHVKSISQEHGTISVGGMDIDQFQVGDLIGILPVHSCLTANLMRSYLTTEGNSISTLHQN